MGLFKRIKNIIRSNINSKQSFYNNDSYSDTNFENFSGNFEDSDLNEKIKHTLDPESSADSLEREYYANLELPYGADFNEIKTSYKRLLKKYHPDKFYGNQQKLEIAQEVVKKLNIAYNYFEQKYNK